MFCAICGIPIENGEENLYTLELGVVAHCCCWFPMQELREDPPKNEEPFYEAQ
jgi:hypothetical protein